MTHSQGKIINTWTETVPEKDQMVDLQEKLFKATLLKLIKELNGDIEKIKKIMYEQKGNIIEEIRNLKRNLKNSGTEEYNN